MSNSKHARVHQTATPAYALKRSLRRSKRNDRLEDAAELWGSEAGL